MRLLVNIMLEVEKMKRITILSVMIIGCLFVVVSPLLAKVRPNILLVVADDLGDVPIAEVLRVLRPHGVAFVKGEKAIKPWPEQIDEWTHYMHDPAGSCVSNDVLVGPPRRLQWVGGPRHGRSHEHTGSLHGLVSAKGRIFDVTDMSSRVSIQLPSRYTLTARDGFNSTILWTREIPDWFNHMFPLTPVALHKGWIEGEERIITAVSGSYRWPKAEKPTVHLFDISGREKPVGPSLSRAGDGWDVQLELDDWEEIAVID